MLALSGKRNRSPSVASHRFGSWTADSTRRGNTRHGKAEALGQSTIVRLVRNALDGLLPEPLDDVLEREAEQRVRVAELLDGLDE
jgi:hypothetical protein